MVELLAPAGSLNKLNVAFQYGADAVYLGGGTFSLRSSEFDYLSTSVGISHARSLGKRVYVAVNVIAHNRDLEPLKEYIQEIGKLRPDAFIVSDLGVFDLCKKYAPDIPIHVSTQANTTNWMSAKKWHTLGAERIILARELSIEEIHEIRQNVPENLQLEVFVHGAMCVAYSGRCLISNYLTNRDSNKGICAQPCRWEFEVREKGKDGGFLGVEESERGTFLFNSKDLCMIRHISALIGAGVQSLKIEGRNKSEYYLATVVKAYRREIDRLISGDDFDESVMEELEKVSHREYCAGLENDDSPQIYGTSSYIRTSEVMAVVLESDRPDYVLCEQRGKIIAGDKLEILQPMGDNITIKSAEIYGEKDFEKLESTSHPTMRFWLKTAEKVPSGSFVRR
jgi:putative protease